MCKFQTYKGKIPYCEYTESACTLCVFENKETYNKAIKNNEDDNICNKFLSKEQFR